MKKFMKISAVVLALLICCAAFASCGGDGGNSSAAGGDTPAADSVKGATETWGNITVLVPEDMTLTGGNILDKENPDVVNIAKKDNAMNYFLITINDTEDGAKMGIDSTKEANEGSKDASFEAGKTWTGVSYEYSGSPAFQAYAEFDGRFAVVQSFGFATDDDVTTSILKSLEVKAAE